jgi:hypothetical protein
MQLLQVYLKGMMIFLQGIETQEYLKYSQEEWAKKRELSGHHTWLQESWQGPGGVVRKGLVGGVRGRKLYDLAHFASLQKLFPPALHGFSIASTKHWLFACLIAAPLTLLASRSSCQASSVGFFLCLMKALYAFSTSSPISSDHQGTQKGAGFDKGTCLSTTFFLHEIKKSID